MSRAVILRAEASHLPLPDESVNLIMTSPPYWQIRDYTDDGESYKGQLGREDTWQEYIASLVAATREWVRVLKPTGSLFVNLGDKYGRGTRSTIHGGRSKSAYADGYRPGECVPTGHDKSLLGLPWRYALALTDELGLTLRAEVIWHKTNHLPESADDRVTRGHEQLFHFTRQQQYFEATDAIRVPAGDYKGLTWKDRRSLPDANPGGHAFGLSRGKANGATRMAADSQGKMLDSVWSIQAEPLRLPGYLARFVDKHYASFPTALVRPVVLGWSPQPGVVLDPLGGTGTVALVATVFGRTGISSDLSASYNRIAEYRVRDGAERAAALGMQRPPKARRLHESLYGEYIDRVDAMLAEDGHG